MRPITKGMSVACQIIFTALQIDFLVQVCDVADTEQVIATIILILQRVFICSTFESTYMSWKKMLPEVM
jgi:hypothetical protein